MNNRSCSIFNVNSKDLVLASDPAHDFHDIYSNSRLKIVTKEIGSVNPEVPLDISGTVFVDGDFCSTGVVKIHGDLFVNGSVESEILEVDGDIIVEETVIAFVLECHGDLIVSGDILIF